MAITLKDICEKYGVSKSTARRKVMKCFPDLKIEQGKTIVLDAEQASIFADWMNKCEPVQTVPVNQFEEVKDSSESGVNQALPHVDIQEEVARLVHEQVQAMRLNQYEQQVNMLNEQVEYLKRENELLHEALKREQTKHVSFGDWFKQKLLGSGE